MAHQYLALGLGCGVASGAGLAVGIGVGLHGRFSPLSWPKCPSTRSAWWPAPAGATVRPRERWVALGRGAEGHFGQDTDATVALIRRLTAENRRWSAERIRGELLKLGIRMGKRTVQAGAPSPRAPSSAPIVAIPIRGGLHHDSRRAA